jgi:hypothetical protein
MVINYFIHQIPVVLDAQYLARGVEAQIFPVRNDPGREDSKRYTVKKLIQSELRLWRNVPKGTLPTEKQKLSKKLYDLQNELLQKYLEEEKEKRESSKVKSDKESRKRKAL